MSEDAGPKGPQDCLMVPAEREVDAETHSAQDPQADNVNEIGELNAPEQHHTRDPRIPVLGIHPSDPTVLRTPPPKKDILK